MICDECLESGFAAQHARKEGRHKQGPRAGQDEQRVDEGVGFDQGSIEIDAEGPRGWLELDGLGGGMDVGLDTG